MSPLNVLEKGGSDNMDGMVMITTEEYARLLEMSEFLDCLEACGVDNWQGYEDAVKMFEEGLEEL